MKIKTRNALLALGLVGGVSGIIYLYTKHKGDDSTNDTRPLLNVNKESWGYWTEINFDKSTFGKGNESTFPPLEIDGDSFFAKYGDGDAIKNEIKISIAQITLATKEPWRLRWIYYSQGGWYYTSNDNG